MTLNEIIKRQPKIRAHLSLSELVMMPLKEEAAKSHGNNYSRLLTLILAERYGLLKADKKSLY